MHTRYSAQGPAPNPFSYGACIDDLLWCELPRSRRTIMRSLLEGKASRLLSSPRTRDLRLPRAGDIGDTAAPSRPAARFEAADETMKWLLLTICHICFRPMGIGSWGASSLSRAWDCPCPAKRL